MQYGFTCLECLIRMELDRIREQADSEKRLACAKEFFGVLANAPEGVAPPFLVPAFDAVYDRYFGGETDPQRMLKQRAGEIMLERLPAAREAVFGAEDPLYAALQYSRIGNYIDFAAFGSQVDFGHLDELLAGARSRPIDEGEYRHFRDDLAAANSFLLITDNAGEIVLDRLVLEVLRRDYPGLDLTVCVRGGPALNDALREDAEAAGIPALAHVVDNGSCIGGMELGSLSAESREALDGASVILAKGQANLETMLGCGRNVYYAFLVKCQRFVTRFGKPLFTPMLVRERS